MTAQHDASAGVPPAQPSLPDTDNDPIHTLAYETSMGLHELALALEAFHPGEAPFQFSWSPFVGALNDNATITVRAATPQELAARVEAALKEIGPVLTQKYSYEWKGRVKTLPAPTPPAAGQPAGAQTGNGQGRRRRGTNPGAPSGASTGSDEGGSFPIKVIKVFRSRFGDRNLVMQVEGTNGEKITDALKPAAWAKYFPAHEQAEWKHDLAEEGTVYDLADGWDPMICRWKRKGEYQNIVRIEYAQAGVS